ncbi:MAG: phage holin family protein [Bacteroidetes bacterium]|nr:MAG: phage holin family protein [Bacteroidota bacterium]
MRFLFSLLLNASLVYLLSVVLPGVAITSLLQAILVVLLLGFANWLVRPVLIILSFPITILSLGLFLFVINGLLVLLVDALLPGFAVANLFWAILFSVFLALLNTLLGSNMVKQVSNPPRNS